MRTGRNFTRTTGRNRSANAETVRPSAVQLSSVPDGTARARLMTAGGEVASGTGATPEAALRSLRGNLTSRGRGVYSEEMRRVDLRAVQEAAEGLRRGGNEVEKGGR